jgi:lipid-A-disaccharide synthase
MLETTYRLIPPYSKSPLLSYFCEMKYYIITGERSGDMHAGNLIRQVRAKDPEAEVRGVGGEYLQDAGADIAWHYDDIAIMGFAEVVLNFRQVLKKFSKVKKDILNYQPEVLILVDFGGFNLRIASFAKKHHIRIFYYITPKVWAWNQKRALKIKRLVDRMLVILPFEKEFYKKFDWEVDYVGNPIFDAIKAYTPNKNFYEQNGLPENRKLIALLPGSRKQELLKVIPLYNNLISRFKEVHFCIAGIKSLTDDLYAELNNLPNASVIFEQTYDLLSNADAAVVTSGTATLETALFNVPQVVVYKTTTVSYAIAKSLIKVDYISLVNLICGKEVVKELIQRDMNPDTVGEELDHLLNDEQRRKQIFSDYIKIRKILGETSASETAAAIMVQDLKDGQNNLGIIHN